MKDLNIVSKGIDIHYGLDSYDFSIIISKNSLEEEPYVVELHGDSESLNLNSDKSFVKFELNDLDELITILQHFKQQVKEVNV